MVKWNKSKNMRFTINIFLTCLLSLFNLSCMNPYHRIGKKDITPTPPLKKEQLTGTVLYADYHIAPGDRLEVFIWQYPEWSREPYGNDWTRDTVKPNGTLRFPLIGNVMCSGLTTDELEKKLEEKLSVYVRSPDVIVYIREYRGRHYYILYSKGGARRMVLDGPIDVVTAVWRAGGGPYQADLDSVFLITDNMTDNPKIKRVNVFKAGKIGIKKKDIIMVKPNDIIYIPNRFIPEVTAAIQEIQSAINATYEMADWKSYAAKTMAILNRNK